MKTFEPITVYFIRNRLYIAAGFVSLIFVDILQLLVPRIIKSVIDSLAGGTASTGMLARYAGFIVAIGFLTAFFRFVWRYCIIGTSRRIERGLRNRMFSHITTLPFAGLVKSRTGDLMARMTNDLEAVRMCTGIGLVALVDTVFLGCAAISFMLYISPLLSLISLTPLTVIVFVTWRLSGMLHHRFSKVQGVFSVLTEKVRETIAGISVIKAYAREGDNNRHFCSISENYIQKNMSLIKIMGLFFPLIVFLSNMSVGALIFFGGRLTIVSAISPGEFVAFASYLWILTWPMMALGWVVSLFQRGSASMKRINEILSRETETAESSENCGGHVIRGELVLRNLTFSYAYGSAPVLKNISLCIRPGETVGITGKTGSGKTSLCALLLRFFNPPPATVFVDGADITGISLHRLRTAVAYVPQDSFLFSDTIAQNIAFGKENSSRQEIRDCARAAQLLHDIDDLQDGFETVIGERGVTLSGGQKQRLCIARALLMKSPFLILDDALSSLDAATTEKVVKELQAADGRRTSIIVANRIASIRHADRIFVFDDGEIVQSGTHRDLLSAEGLYRNLYLRQQLENETDQIEP